MKSVLFYRVFQWCAGAGDAATGFLLMLAPGFALRMMGIAQPPAELVFVSFVGAFVFAVGLSTLFFLRYPRTPSELASVRTLWLITGVQRLCVALFVAGACFGSKLEPAWLLVSGYDLAFAILQLAVLRPRYQERAP